MGLGGVMSVVFGIALIVWYGGGQVVRGSSTPALFAAADTPARMVALGEEQALVRAAATRSSARWRSPTPS